MHQKQGTLSSFVLSTLPQADFARATFTYDSGVTTQSLFIRPAESFTQSLNLAFQVSKFSPAKIIDGATLKDLRPYLTRDQKSAAISVLKDLFADSTFQVNCAEICKQSGSNFKLKDLSGELNKAVQIFEHYLTEVEEGKHEYAHIHGNNIAVQRPYGRIMGFTASNYPIGENAAVIGVLNSILAGCPIDLRMGASSTAKIDSFMASSVIEALKDIVPDGFIGTVKMGHKDSREILSKYAGIFFIGGSTGIELLSYTEHQVGNLQTGRANWMLVMKEKESLASELLLKAVESRFGLSCSGPSIAFLEEDSDSIVTSLLAGGSKIKAQLLSEGENFTPDARFQRSLEEARDFYIKAGARLVSDTDHYLTVLTMGINEFKQLREAVTLPELFGPAFLLVEGTNIPRAPSASNAGDLPYLPEAKTGIVVGLDQDAFVVATSCTNKAGRISNNIGSSTPGPGPSYLHTNIDGHPAEQHHIISPQVFLMPKEVYPLPASFAATARKEWGLTA